MKRFLYFLLLIFTGITAVSAHIEQGAGAGLQLYSFKMLGIAPKIDGTIDGAWGGAYMREVTLTDRTKAQLWFMNNDENLFVAVRYAHDDGGSGNGVILYWDEGGNTGLMVEDGPHDDEISTPEAGARNEDGVAARLAGGAVKLRNLSWDGKDWKEDNVPSPDLQAAARFVKGVYSWEFRIPLDNINDDNRDGSDLDVGGTDELGMLLEVVKDGEGKGTWYWDQTNRQPGNAVQGAGWADLQLGFDTRDVTLYATMALAGAPEVDGTIDGGSSPDKAWQGAFSRDINLTNFQGSRHRATVLFIDSPETKSLYAGIKVFDRTENSGDYCEIFQEENNIVPASLGNMVLDAGFENGARAAGRTGTDLGWNGTAWVEDAGTPANQAAAGTFYPLGGVPHYEYEFSILKNGGKDDLQLKDGGAVGFLIHYFDADMPAGKQSFYWEYSANVPGVVTDSGAPALATGWPLLQSGAPSFQVVSPADDATVGGGFVLRTYVGASKGIKDVASVSYKIRGEESWKNLEQVAGSSEWTAVWKTDAKPDGEYTVLFEGKDGLGNQLVTRAVNVEVKNARTASLDPSVKVSTPRAGEIVSGASYVVNFSARAVSPQTVASTQFGVDGGSWSLTGSATAHNWNTTGLPDGSHFVRIRVTDSDGVSAVSEPVQVVVDNSAPVASATASPAAVTDGGKVVFEADAGIPGLSVVVPVDQLKLLDSGAGADLILEDRAGNGRYRAGYTVSTDNSVPDGTKKIICRLRDAQGNAYDAAVTVTLDNTAPVILSLACGDADNIYRNGETVRLSITCDAAGYDLTANFSAIDNAYASGKVALSSAGNGGQAAYTISTENTLPAGKYTVTVVAADGVGLTARKSVELFLDNEGPAVTAAKTEDADAVLAADDRLSVQAKDGQHDIQRLEYFIDVPGVPGAGTELIGAAEGYTAPLSVTGLAPGAHTAYIRGRDTAGNDGPVFAMPFTVDTAHPVLEDIRIGYPDGRPAADGRRFTVAARVHDAVSRVAHVNALAGELFAGGTVPMADDGKGGDAVAGDRIYTAVITPDKSVDGTVMLTVSAEDAVGNSVVSAPVPVDVDNDAPVVSAVTVASPDNIFRNGETVLLAVTADAPGYRALVDYGTVDGNFRQGCAVVQDNNDNTYAAACPISAGNAVIDGEYDINIILTDVSGNRGSGTVKVVLDNTGPVVDACTFADADRMLSADDAVTVTLTDARTAVAAGEVFVDMVREPGTGVAVTPQKDGYGAASVTGTAPVALAGLAEGSHILYARGRDTAGNWGRVMAVPFTIDRMAPVVGGVAVAYPGGQSAAADGQKVRVTAQVTDAVAGLDAKTVILNAGELNGTAKEVVMTDDGTGADLAAKDGVYSAAVTVKNGKTGSVPVTVAAADLVPHTCEPVRAAVMVDNTPPKVVSVTDTDADHVYANGQTVRLIAVLDGAGYGVTADFSTMDSRYVPGAGAVAVNGDTAYIAYVLGTDNSRAGDSYAITVTATDAMGLSHTEKTKIVLDNTGPAVTLKSDDADGILNAVATVSVKAKDGEQAVTAVRYAVDALPGDGTAGDVPVEDGTVKLDPAALAQGAHTLYVQARNAAGTWGACAMLPFTVDTRAPLAGPVTVTYPENRTVAGAEQQIVIAVRIADAGVGVDPTKLTLDASAFGGGKKDMLKDDGLGGDAIAGDGVYSAAITVKAKNGGAKPFTVTAADKVPNTVEIKGTVNVDPDAPDLKLASDKLADKLKGKVTEKDLLLTGTYKADDIVSISLDHTFGGKARPGMPRAIPVTAAKNFSQPLDLLTGENTVTAVAVDKAGNMTTVTAVFTYEIPQVK